MVQQGSYIGLFLVLASQIIYSYRKELCMWSIRLFRFVVFQRDINILWNSFTIRSFVS